MRIFIAGLIISLASSSSALAGIRPIEIAAVPTLSEWGMIVAVALLGITGLIALSRRAARAGR